MSYQCPSCASKFAEDQVQRPIEGKTTGCLIGLAAGAATENPWAALAAAAAGVLFGHVVDEVVGPKCPLCAVALKRVISAYVVGG